MEPISMIGKSTVNKCKVNKPMNINMLNNIFTMIRNEYGEQAPALIQSFMYRMNIHTSFNDIYTLLGTDNKKYMLRIKDSAVVNTIFKFSHVIEDGSKYAFKYDHEIITSINGHKLKLILCIDDEFDSESSAYIVDYNTNMLLAHIYNNTIYVYNDIAKVCGDYSIDLSTNMTWHKIEYSNLPASIVPAVTECITLLNLGE